MRFGLVHRVMTDALAALGILAVVSTASMSPWANIVVVVGLAMAIAIPDAWQSKPAMVQFANLAPAAVAIIQVTRLMLGRPWLDVLIELGTMIQVVRVATRRGAAHDQQIILLALIHFVAGTVLGGGLTYGLCFLGFLVVAPGALVLSHLRREVEGNYRQGARDRTGLPVDVPRILRSRRVVGRGFLAATCLLALPIFFFTAVLFVMFPRVGLSLLLLQHSHGDRMIGFSDKVDLGEVGLLRDDPSIALRFDISELPEPPPARYPLRFRGTAFDTTDGRAWSRSLPDRHPEFASQSDLSLHPGPRSQRTVTIDLEPIDPPVVFLPPRTVIVRVKRPAQSVLTETIGIHQGPEDELRYTGNDGRGLRYDAVVNTSPDVLPEVLPLHDRARYLTIPAKLPMRIAELAHKWTDGLPTEAAKAHSIEEHLRTEYAWDRNSPSGAAPDPLDDFLFVSRRGHCSFFSTAMAIMLRDVGIPSRNVTGFVGGSYNRFGHYYAVREGDAHSWVEAYIDDQQSWQTFDPTPAVGVQPTQETGVLGFARDLIEALSQRWNRYVINYDLKTQMHLFEDIGRKYDRFRKSAGVSPNTAADKVTSGPVVAVAIAVLLYASYVYWRRRRRPADKTATRSPRDPNARTIETATALYRALETALSLQGVSRPASLPPLRHAEEMERRRHPLGVEVVSLTMIYLESRFGGAELTDTMKRDFERRVKEIRAYRPEPKVATAKSADAAA